MSLGIPEPKASLFDRIRVGSRVAPTSPDGPIDAGRQIDTGGLSAAGFGTSPIAQGGYGQSSQHPGVQAVRITDGYQAAPQSANGTTMAPARLVQRINPQTVGRGGVRKEYEGA